MRLIAVGAVRALDPFLTEAGEADPLDAVLAGEEKLKGEMPLWKRPSAFLTGVFWASRVKKR